MTKHAPNSIDRLSLSLHQDMGANFGCIRCRKSCMRRCGLLDGGAILAVCRVLLAMVLLFGVHLMLMRRSHYVRHREWLVSCESPASVLYGCSQLVQACCGAHSCTRHP